jgi:hypothetical protein
MKIEKYLDALESFERLLRDTGGKAVADDTRRVIGLLGEYEGLTVQQFVTKAHKALDAPAGAPAKKAAAAARPAERLAERPVERPVDQAAVSRYLDLLAEEKIAILNVDTIIRQLKDDSDIRAEELFAIADKIVRSGRRYSTKKQAFDDLRSYLAQRVGNRRRIDYLDRGDEPDG